MSYQTIRLDDMDALLNPLGFKRGKINGTMEWVYARGIQVTVNGVKVDFALTVYSSIDIATGVSRPAGADAIRVCITKRRDTYIDVMAGEKRVNRTENWRANLLERINRVTDNFIACPSCSAPMVKREYKGRAFLGCSMYRINGCRGTREV